MDYLYCTQLPNQQAEDLYDVDEEVFYGGIPLAAGAATAASIPFHSRGAYGFGNDNGKVQVKKKGVVVGADGCKSYSSFPMAFTVGIIVGVLVGLLLGKSNLAPGWIVVIATILGYIVATMFCHKKIPKSGGAPSSFGCDLTAAFIALLSSWGVVSLMREYGNAVVPVAVPVVTARS